MEQGQAAALKKSRDLLPRIGSALVLAGGAVLTAWIGGWPFKIGWFLLSAIVFREWMAILCPSERIDTVRKGVPYVLLLGCFLGPVSVILLTDGPTTWRMLIAAIAVCGIALGVFAAVYGLRLAKWAMLGCAYATLLFGSVALLRLADGFGLAVIFFLFAVVWGADVGAYFAGRTIGGPKLAPSISPNKTWSGFCGGMVSGVVLALSVLAFAGVPLRPAHAVIAAALALASVGGDLFESYFKRRFGVKDSGHLIPGHGGFMDRLDGFIFAAVLAALIGVARNGVDGAGAGLLGGW